MKKIYWVLLLFIPLLYAEPCIDLVVDVFFKEARYQQLAGKKIGLITNHTSISSDQKTTLELFQGQGLKVVALFFPEHGSSGTFHAEEKFEDQKAGKILSFSLYGNHRRPTAEMLKEIDALVYDIQEIGCRSYTYATTLFYVMEEAAKKGIEVWVLDRPNPLGGVVVDGPMLKEKLRSFVGYINVPYCHGMTIGELARFFNQEYKVNCRLKVVPMKGWKRGMTFAQTGLIWIPTSPQIPEADTPFFYPATGLLGELQLVSIGVGYTLPFKVVGAPWIDAGKFAFALNHQKLGGVKFLPFHFKPFFGPYKHEECHGVRLVVTNPQKYHPVTTDFLMLGILKSLYPGKLKHDWKTCLRRKRRCFVNSVALQTFGKF